MNLHLLLHSFLVGKHPMKMKMRRKLLNNAEGMLSCFFLFNKSCQKSTSSDVLAFSIGACRLFIAESSVRLGLRCPKIPKRAIHHYTI